MHHITHQQSYDAWKAKCAKEKVQREATKYEHPESRKRIYPFTGETGTTPLSMSSSSSSRKTYVTLPTIPPIRVHVDMEMSTVVVPEKKRFLPASKTNSAPSMPMSTYSSRYQLPPLANATLLPTSSSSHSHNLVQKCGHITPISTPPELSHAEYVLSPEISSAIRALPTSQLLAALERGQSVFRRAPSIPSFQLIPLPEKRTMPFDQYTKPPQSMCVPNSQHNPFCPLIKFPLNPNMAFLTNQSPPS